MTIWADYQCGVWREHSRQWMKGRADFVRWFVVGANVSKPPDKEGSVHSTPPPPPSTTQKWKRSKTQIKEKSTPNLGNDTVQNLQVSHWNPIGDSVSLVNKCITNCRGCHLGSKGKVKQRGAYCIVGCGKSYLGWILQVDHCRIVNALARCGFSGMDQIAEGRRHVFDGVDQHNL